MCRSQFTYNFITLGLNQIKNKLFFYLYVPVRTSSITEGSRSTNTALGTMVQKCMHKYIHILFFINKPIRC